MSIFKALYLTKYGDSRNWDRLDILEIVSDTLYVTLQYNIMHNYTVKHNLVDRNVIPEFSKIIQLWR